MVKGYNEYSILIVDHTKRQIHYFDPNYPEKYNLIDERRRCVDALDLKGYTLVDVVEGVHASVLSTNELIDNELIKSSVERGACAGCCYYHLMCIMKGKKLGDGFDTLSELDNTVLIKNEL